MEKRQTVGINHAYAHLHKHTQEQYKKRKGKGSMVKKEIRATNNRIAEIIRYLVTNLKNHSILCYNGTAQMII